MTPHAAETFALNVLTWLIGDQDLLPIFMNSTGTDGDALRENAGSPEFLGAVLDFLLMDDAWVLRCCEETGLDPNLMMTARAALPGGQQMHWT